MSRSQKSVGSQQQQRQQQSQQQKQKIPQIPPDGMLIYGNGLVFGGSVYPVLVDGVPMQSPVGAQQAAAQQRWQMMHGPALAQKPVNVPGPKQNQNQNLQQRPRQRQQLQQHETGSGYPNMSPRHPQSCRPKTRTRLQSQPPRNSVLSEYPPQCPANSSAPNITRGHNRGYGMPQQQQQQKQGMPQQQQQQQQGMPQQQQEYQHQLQQLLQLQSAMDGHYNYGYMTNASDAGGWSGYAMMPPMVANRPYSFGWSPLD